MYQVQFPNTPEQVTAALDLAREGPIAIERDGAAIVVITTVEDYELLAARDQPDVPQAG